MLNTNTTLPCGYSGPDGAISWWADGRQLTNNALIFDVNKYAQNWDPASGKADLIVMNTQDSDAVQYRCNLGQSAKEAYAQLVVLGKYKFESYYIVIHPSFDAFPCQDYQF